MICIASIVSAIYVVKFQKKAELFLAKKRSAFRKCGGFFEDIKNQEKKIVGSKARTRDLHFAVHRSNHYSIPLSLEGKLKITYIKKTKKNILS